MRFNQKSALLLIAASLGMVTCNIIAALPEGYPDTPRTKERLVSGWKFFKGQPDAKFYETDFDDSQWDAVTIPHPMEYVSLSLNDSTDDKEQMTFLRDVGWYRRNITADVSRRVFLEFEGSHQVTDVWVNGRHVGQHVVGGYTPFHFDITDFVRPGETNQVTVRADNRKREDVPPDPGPFDYVKFAGLYRDVYLVQTDPVHITFPWEARDAGVRITQPSVDPVNLNATLRFETAVRNSSSEPREVTVTTRVIDANNLVVLRLEETSGIDAGRDVLFDQIGGITDGLRLWSTDDPYLYRVNTQVSIDGKAVDMVENPLGVRKVELTMGEGLLLNGKPIKLIGMNRHQHYGIIGDALPDSLHVKDMQQFKDLGFNIMRAAHYPHDNAVLEACDRLGILVYEEAPTWIDMGEGKWYDNLELAARHMVRNHRNHPSVIIWGAGINHRGPVPQMQYAVKQEDPDRITASQGARWTGPQSSGVTDLYANMLYGPYYWSGKEPLLAMEGGTDAHDFNEYLDHPAKIGLIGWTAHSYFTFHPSKDPKDRARGGMMTVFRHPKDKIPWYPSELKDEPYLHIVSDWKPDMKTFIAYSNAEELHLRLNGKKIGVFQPSSDKRYNLLKHPPFEIPIGDFEPGTLDVVGYSAGKETVRQTIRTPEAPAAIRLVMDMANRDFLADGSDIMVGYAFVTDEHGTTINDAKGEITFEVEGPATIVGEGREIGGNPVVIQRGHSPVLLRAGAQPGKITIKASSKGLKSDQVELETRVFHPDVIASNAKPIYDFEKIEVDIGGDGQLLQFDWTPWVANEPEGASLKFEGFGGFEAKLTPGSPEGVLRWLGEMNVIGDLGFVYGDGVIAMDKEGLVLAFDGLPQGTYRLKTWHHAPQSNTDSMDPNRERLKTVKINELPFSENVVTMIKDADGERTLNAISATTGKDRQTELPGTQELIVRSDGTSTVRVTFRPTEANKGVWLNGFVLQQWFNAKNRK